MFVSLMLLHLSDSRAEIKSWMAAVVHVIVQMSSGNDQRQVTSVTTKHGGMNNKNPQRGPGHVRTHKQTPVGNATKICIWPVFDTNEANQNRAHSNRVVIGYAGPLRS